MDKLERHHTQQGFEHELINRRLTWLLTSQTILFASLAFLLDKETIVTDRNSFLHIVSSLGMGISVLVWIGIVMGIFAKYTNWKDYKNAYDKSKPWGERTWITVFALCPDVLMPLAFLLAWCNIRGMME